jgi:hypothetical protein
MTSLETAFLKAWGRPPTRIERERIQRLRDAFSIDENDAFLTIVMVLEFYDGVFRLYPDKCAAAVRVTIKECLSRLAAPPSPTPAPHLSTSIADKASDWIALGGLVITFMVLVGVGMVTGAALVAQSKGLTSLAGTAAWLVPVIVLVYGGAWGWQRLRRRGVDTSAQFES